VRERGVCDGFGWKDMQKDKKRERDKVETNKKTEAALIRKQGWCKGWQSNVKAVANSLKKAEETYRKGRQHSYASEGGEEVKSNHQCTVKANVTLCMTKKDSLAPTRERIGMLHPYLFRLILASQRARRCHPKRRSCIRSQTPRRRVRRTLVSLRFHPWRIICIALMTDLQH